MSRRLDKILTRKYSEYPLVYPDGVFEMGDIKPYNGVTK